MMQSLFNIFISNEKEALFAIGTISVVNWAWSLYSAAAKRQHVERLLSSLLVSSAPYKQQQREQNHNRDEIHSLIYVRRMFYVVGSFMGGLMGYKLGKICHKCGVVTGWAPSVGAVLGTMSGWIAVFFVWLPLVSLCVSKMMEQIAAGCDYLNDVVDMDSRKTVQSDWWEQHKKHPILAMAKYFQTVIIVQAQNHLDLRKYYIHTNEHQQQQQNNKVYKSKLAMAEKRFLFAFSITLTWHSLIAICWFEWLFLEWGHEEEHRQHVLVIAALICIPIVYPLRFFYALQLYRRIRRIKGRHPETVWKSMHRLFVRSMIRNACDLFESAVSLPTTENMKLDEGSVVKRRKAREDFFSSSSNTTHHSAAATTTARGTTASHGHHEECYCWHSPDGKVMNAISYWKLYFVITHGTIVGPGFGVTLGTLVGRFVYKWTGNMFHMAYLSGICSGILISVGSLYGMIFFSEHVLCLVLGKTITYELSNHMQHVESNLVKDWNSFWFPPNKTTSKNKTAADLSSVVLVGKLNVQTQKVEDVSKPNADAFGEG